MMTTQIRRAAMLVLLTLLTGTNFGAQERAPTPGDGSTTDAARVIGERRSVKGIGNFGEVTPTLLRGGQPTAEGFHALAKMGVDIVVDTRGGRSQTAGEAKAVSELGMRYVAIPWHCPFPHDEVFVQFLKLLHDNAGKKVFVHCRLGDDRTGMMVAAYRMAEEGWSAEEAMQEMRHFGFTRAHHFICPRLESYEQGFPQRMKENPAFDGVRSDAPVNSGAAR